MTPINPTNTDVCPDAPFLHRGARNAPLNRPHVYFPPSMQSSASQHIRKAGAVIVGLQEEPLLPRAL